MPKTQLLNCLVVDDEEDLRDVIGFCIESEFNAQIHFAKSGNEAIRILEENKFAFDVIVSDYKMADGDGALLFKYLADSKNETPFILLSTIQPNENPIFKMRPLAGFAEKPFFQKSLVAAISEIIKSKAEINFESALRNYGRIHIRLLRRVEILPCDVFIRLSESKFVKVYSEGDIFTQEDLEKYQSKNVDYLEISIDSFDSIFQKLMKVILSNQALNEIDTATMPMDFEFSQDILDSIHSLGSMLGYTPELEKLTKANIEYTLKILSKNPALSELLNRIKLDYSKYIASHSILLSTICYWIAQKMGWSSDQTLYKLTLAAFLHDITISDPELAKVQHVSEFKNDRVRFSAAGVAQWKEHPIKAAQIAEQFDEIPPDVDVIIIQHHENPQGTGFPFRISANRLSPLSSLFIIAHDLVHFYQNNATHSLLSDFISSNQEKYDVGVFKKIIKAIA